MIFDRDAIFSAGLTATIRSMLMEPTRTSYQNPWLNGVAERFVGTVRQELLGHVIVLNARHLRQLIEPFATYYNADRTHIELGKDSPCVRPVEQMAPSILAPGVESGRTVRTPRDLPNAVPHGALFTERVLATDRRRAKAARSRSHSSDYATWAPTWPATPTSCS